MISASSAGSPAGSGSRAESPTKANDTSTTTSTPTTSETTATTPSAAQLMVMCLLRSGRDVNRRRWRGQVVDVVGGDRATTRRRVDAARDAEQHEGHDDRADRAGVRHPGGDGAECGGRGQGQQPCEGDLTADAPVHGAGPASRSGAEDRAGGDLRGGQRETEM